MLSIPQLATKSRKLNGEEISKPVPEDEEVVASQLEVFLGLDTGVGECRMLYLENCRVLNLKYCNGKEMEYLRRRVDLE